MYACSCELMYCNLLYDVYFVDMIRPIIKHPPRITLKNSANI